MISQSLQSERLRSIEPARCFTPGPVLADVLRAQADIQALFAPSCYRSRVEELAQVVEQAGHRYLHGSSDAGIALSGALAYRVAGARIWTPGERRRVLLVEAIVVSLAGLGEVARWARTLGAIDVDALVVGTDDPATPDSVDTLYILDHEAARAA
jgi:hypothetical protein